MLPMYSTDDANVMYLSTMYVTGLYQKTRFAVVGGSQGLLGLGIGGWIKKNCAGNN